MYQYKELYILDFSRVSNLEEIHKIIKESLDFPDHYGKNMDAFWDCLTDMITDPYVHIELRGIEHIQSLFPKETQMILDIMKDFKHYSDDDYRDKIKIEIIIGNAKHEIH